MKNFKNYKKSTNIFFLCSVVILMLFFSSCSVSSLGIRVLVPAEITINKEIIHIGIVNRSLPDNKRKIIDIVEGFISGESILADRFGSENCLKGLAEKLNNSPRFSAVIIQGENLRGTGTRMFPNPLSWRIVGRLCNKYRVDALIALETFDSNIVLDKDIRMKKKTIKDKKTKTKKKVKVPQYIANLYIQVNSGWKIYDPSARSIVDANTYRDEKSWYTTGKTRRESLENLPNKRDAINQAGYHSGIQYGKRISPTWINVNREYYVKGCPEFKMAERYVKSGDWKQAISIWKKLLHNSDIKIAGRAAYNIAFAAEIRGDFQNALKWAKRSYAEFGNKKAHSYMRILNQRISDKEHLDEQLK